MEPKMDCAAPGKEEGEEQEERREETSGLGGVTSCGGVVRLWVDTPSRVPTLGWPSHHRHRIWVVGLTPVETME